jgi:hypothetical protein
LDPQESLNLGWRLFISSEQLAIQGKGKASYHGFYNFLKPRHFGSKHLKIELTNNTIDYSKIGVFGISEVSSGVNQIQVFCDE